MERKRSEGLPAAQGAGALAEGVALCLPEAPAALVTLPSQGTH